MTSYRPICDTWILARPKGQRIYGAFPSGFYWRMRAMLWRGKNNKPQLEWRRFQRTWARPTIVAASDRQIAETGQDNRAGLFNV